MDKDNVPFSSWDPALDPPYEAEDYDDEEPEDYAAMPEMGTCDGPGCMIMYEVANGLDHCVEEGTCWLHCTSVEAHTQAQGITVPVLGDGVKTPLVEWSLGPPDASLGIPKVNVNKFLPSIEEVQELLNKTLTTAENSTIEPFVDESVALIADELDAPPMPDTFDLKKTLAYVNEAIAVGPNEVFQAARGILDQVAANEYVPTSAERVALFVAGLEAIAYAEHGQVVAITEGRTLAKHRADFSDNECGVCENLDAYTKNALDLLKPIAVEQVNEIQEQKIEQLRILKGVCVDCGEKPKNNRTYSLEDGKGYMCSRCAGPYLMMDDGKPGDPFDEEEAQA